MRKSRVRVGCDSLAFDDVVMLDDCEGLGRAFDGVGGTGSLLCGPDIRMEGPRLVVTIGDGLDTALCLPQPGGVQVAATEAGRMNFAPGTAREHEVLVQLAAGGDYVSYERILSCPGLSCLYSTLCRLRGEEPNIATPAAIVAAARAANDAVAVDAVDMFCAVLGAFVGNLAVVFMARGGVCLSVAALPGVAQLLQRSPFVERFLDKGPMRQFLVRVPVRVIKHGQDHSRGAERSSGAREKRREGMMDCDNTFVANEDRACS